jgi:transcriptional regulator with XRE-family HTH domain
MDKHTFFGENLRKLRKKANLTQAQLADKIGKSTEFVSKLERSESFPSFNTLVALKEVFDRLNFKMEVFPEDGDEKSISELRMNEFASIVSPFAASLTKEQARSLFGLLGDFVRVIEDIRGHRR